MLRNLLGIEGFDVTFSCSPVFHLPRSFGGKSLKVCKPLSKWGATRKPQEKYLCRFSIEVEGQITFGLKVGNTNVADSQTLTGSRIR